MRLIGCPLSLFVKQERDVAAAVGQNILQGLKKRGIRSENHINSTDRETRKREEELRGGVVGPPP